MTPTERKSFHNRQANEYRREAIDRWQLRGPYRQSLYIQARLAGSTPEQAIEQARSKGHWPVEGGVR